MVLQWRQGLTGEGLGTTDLLPLKEQNITGPGATEDSGFSVLYPGLPALEN